MKSVNYGVIGLGFFGEKHCEALATLPQVNIYALCTRTESRLAELGEKFGADKTFTDYNEMLADPDLDAVSVVTMYDQHKEPAIAALEAGKHVLLEKPMASTLEDCQAIVQAAKAASGFFMVGHICRFNPRYAAAKEAIAEGRIGKIVSMYARRNIPAWVGTDVLPKIGPIIGDWPIPTSAGQCTALTTAQPASWKMSGFCPTTPRSRLMSEWRLLARRGQYTSTRRIRTSRS